MQIYSQFAPANRSFYSFRFLSLLEFDLCLMNNFIDALHIFFSLFILISLRVVLIYFLIIEMEDFFERKTYLKGMKSLGSNCFSPWVENIVHIPEAVISSNHHSVPCFLGRRTKVINFYWIGRNNHILHHEYVDSIKLFIGTYDRCY